MTLLIDLISSFHKFLGYLEISPKYLNRAYTILSVFPTLYILRIIYGLWLNQHYGQLLLYSAVFLILVYFIVLNTLYYFFNRNSKFDITQLFAKYLPEDALNVQDTNEKKKKTKIQSDLAITEVAIDFRRDHHLLLEETIEQCLNAGILTKRTTKEGYVLPKDTLFPFYDISKIGTQEYVIRIGTSYQRLFEIGRVRISSAEEALKPVGLFIRGGDFYMNDRLFHEPYTLKLLIHQPTQQQIQADKTTTLSRQSRRQLRHQ